MIRKSARPLSESPVVVKIGGSLRNRVSELILVFQSSERPLFIIPGGGIYADAVRKSRVDNDSAHWMAIAAMDQYGWFIASQGMTTTALLQVPDRPVVFLPYCCMRQHDPLPHTWDVTSDSIAAWIADFLGLDLLVLKTVDGIFKNGNLMKQVNMPVNTDVVDPFFIPFVLKKEIMTTVINGSRIGCVKKYLRGETVPGTRIGTTF